MVSLVAATPSAAANPPPSRDTHPLFCHSSPMASHVHLPAGLFLASILVCPVLAASHENLDLLTRSRTGDSNHTQVVQKQVQWPPQRTAIVICDMWDDHWCKGASGRVAEMAPHMNEVVKRARDRGVFIIHAPSDVVDFYKDTPQRKRAQAAPSAAAPTKIDRWRRIDREKEGPFPIDDADGGCDDLPPCKTGGPYPWKRQIATIEIAPQDAITDSGQEAYNLMQERGITNVIVMGVHANMCVLGRSFAIRQMVLLGKNVVLMRDMTDTMYNSRARPKVNHFRGTDLVIEHIERYWCPTITSTAFTGKPEFRFKADPLRKASASSDLPEDLAGNEAVRDHMRRFKGRGQLVEQGIPPSNPRDTLKQLKVPEGLELQLVASEPAIRQPVCLNFDERGRLWVVQYLQYPFPAGLKIVKYDEHLRAVFDKVPPPPPNHFPGADKITILEDEDRDGYFEKTRDFVTGLNIATSALPGRGGVWVMNPPYLLFYPDKNHDDVPDGPPEVRLEGFGLEDTHAVANSLTWGPDGWLYGAQGSTCTATVRGIRFLGQAIWRYHPLTREFELFAEGGGNTFCIEFDRKGRLFSGTNWGNQRGLYFVQGGYYVKGWGKHGPLTNPHAYGFFNHMPHQGDEARFSHSFIIYEADALPEKYFGQIFGIVPLHNRVQVAQLVPDGSSLKTRDTERVVESADKWFRPVDIKVGPDGAVYLADWYDIRLSHVDPHDNWDKSNGRIYRLTTKGAPTLKPFDLGKASDDELIKTLSHSNKWWRQMALRVIGDRANKALAPKLRELALQSTGQTARDALWAAHLCGGMTRDFAARALAHSDEDVRAWAVRLSVDSGQIARDQLIDLARRDQSPFVRSQLAASARRLPPAQAIDLAQELAARDPDASDPYLPLLVWWAVERHAITARDKVMEAFGTSSAWRQKIPAEYILPRLAQRYGAEGTREGLETVTGLLQSAPGGPEREKLLRALAEAYKGRTIENPPDALRAAVASIAGGNELLVTKVRLGLANPAEIKTATEKLQQTDKPAELIEALGMARVEAAIPVLLETATGKRSSAIRKSALQSLQHFSTPEIAPRLLNAWSEFKGSADLRTTALELLSRRKPWSLEVLKAVEQGTIARTDVPFDVVERIRRHDDPAIAQLTTKFWGRTRQTPAELQQRIAVVAKTLSGHGDASRGKQIFATTCATCHKLHGEGQTIGPDLTGYERDNLDFLLLSIVDPNAGIREEYTNFELQTTDDLLLTGYVVERAAQAVTIEDAQQGRVTVPQNRIKSLRASALSRMPEGLLDALNDEQIRDLFAYIRSPGPTAKK
jgi:putative membrane-bound dehydrogenase-like protein